MKTDPAFLIADDASADKATYTRLGSYVDEADLSNLYAAAMERLYIAAGAGGFINAYQTNISKHDRFNLFHPTPVIERTGLTLMTRPRLNLSDSNVRMDRNLMALDTTDPASGGQNIKNINFVIRCLLDTYFCSKNREYTEKCGLLNPYSPFMLPLCNNLIDISGWPDFNVDSETMDGGFHNEDYTFAGGSDMLNRSCELTLTFREVMGGLNMAIIYIWLLCMALLRKGRIMAYEDDIYEQRLNYTVSIYRAILDPSGKYITRWAKATGCFPKSVPNGSCFNINAGESTVSAIQQFSVPFAVNKVEYNPDFGPLKDFNRLMTRYVGGIDGGGMYKLPIDPNYNGLGYPFIVSGDGGLELEYRAFPEEVEALIAKNTIETEIKAIIAKNKANREALINSRVSQSDIEIYKPEPNEFGNDSTEIAYVSLEDVL